MIWNSESPLNIDTVQVGNIITCAKVELDICKKFCILFIDYYQSAIKLSFISFIKASKSFKSAEIRSELD